jgi:diguanylate cyclase
VRVAGTLQSRLRTSDSLARLGGDEFAIILANVSLEQAHRLAATLRELISHASIASDGARLHVTASIGVAGLDADVSSEQDAFVHADQAMYRAKKQPLGAPERG